MNNAVIRKLEINVVSIVIGALVFIAIRYWTETIIEACNYHLKKNKKDKGIHKSFITSLLISLIIVFLIILIYMYFKSKGLLK